MKYFIDFEATQYSERVISIGCINEQGKTFYSLVKPMSGNWRITSFITELTGITKEMIAGAPSTNEAFHSFMMWLTANSDNTRPEFYCYGNCDERYLRNAIKEMTNLWAIAGAATALANLKDYAPTVAKYFNIEAVGLNRVYKSLLHDDHTQSHDALEDARMLKFITENLEASELRAVDLAPPTPKPGTASKIPTPELYRSWSQGKGQLWKADTKADENNYAIKCSCTSDLHHKYFDSMDTAILWVMRYLGGGSPRKQENWSNIRKNLNKALTSDKAIYGLKWSN